MRGVAVLLTCHSAALTFQTVAATGWPPAGGAEPAGFVWAIMLPVAEDTAAIGAIKNAKGSAGPACTSSGILG